MRAFKGIYYTQNATTYLIDGGSELCLIDVGWVRQVREKLTEFKQDGFNLKKIKKIIVSHTHADHVGGLSLAKELLRCEIIAHPLAAMVIEEGDSIAMAGDLPFCDFYEPTPKCKVDVLIDDGDIIKVGALEFEVFHTPGHTPGSIALKWDKYLMVGDTLLPGGRLGWVDAHWGSSPEDYLKSLKLIKSLKPDYILPTHGVPYRFSEKEVDLAIKRIKFYCDDGANGMGSPRPTQWGVRRSLKVPKPPAGKVL